MNKEELKKHCEKKLKFANTPFVPDKEVAEHRLILKILKENEAYENMRKEARKFIKIHGYYDIEIGRITSELTDDELTDLLNILNKVGEDNE